MVFLGVTVQGECVRNILSGFRFWVVVLLQLKRNSASVKEDSSFSFRFEKLWAEEVALKGSEEAASMGKVAFRFVRTRQIISATVLVISMMSSFITSVSISRD